MHQLAVGLRADAQTVFPSRCATASATDILAVITFQVSVDGIDLAPDFRGPAMEQVRSLMLV